MVERIDEYRENNYMNHSEAVRSLLRAGLDAETADAPDEVETATDDGDEQGADGIPDEMDVFGISRTVRTVGGAAVMVVLVLYIGLSGGFDTIATAAAAFVGALVGAML
ncbi:hypothetical protein GJ629_15345 [Halapricum sp. CBA1109]|uniref:ribbon-helix-helix domain-containing protein n=1 Tax=Halapricum sp. CBA1109 TaxID=2668068 RepID=UPI0012FA4A49|nr:ribbon-helix-helix domain-containing protein [Halapricum sp. CBA1109]MUV91093.1 hypothetical protein [Halapricum sp. CBA1109]